MDFYIVSYLHAFTDEYILSYCTVLTDSYIRHYVREMPYPGTISDLTGLFNNAGIMDEAAILLLVAIGFVAGGDGKGLAALALLSPSLLFAATLGGMILLLLYSLLKNEPRAPGYAGFLCGVFCGGVGDFYSLQSALLLEC